MLYLHRYAFTPLIDDSEDEEIEEFIATSNFGTVEDQRNRHYCRNDKCLRFVFSQNICFFFFLSAGMKLRTSKSETNGSVKSNQETNQVSNSGVPIHIVK